MDTALGSYVLSGLSQYLQILWYCLPNFLSELSPDG